MDSRWYRTDIPREEVLYSLRSMMMQIAICIRSPFTVSITHSSGSEAFYIKAMTKYSFLRLRLLRTIREWICSANMIDIEHFTKIFYSLGEIDQSIVKKYIHGDSIRNISRCLGYSESFIYERIYKFHKKIRKVSRHEKAQDFD